MSSKIVIDPVTRIEGHAKITLDLDERGEVADAHFHVVELRGFEKICEGRPFEEMPGLLSRVCGICPISHAIASSKAGDAILGVAIPKAAIAQRRLATYAQILQSHALSFFHLSSPDLLLGFDADLKTRNLFGVAALAPELARGGIRLRQLGQKVIELVGGKRIHAVWSVPGGVTTAFSEASGEILRSLIGEAYATIERALGAFKGVLEKHADEIENLGSFPSLFLGTVDKDDQLEFYDGRLKLGGARGEVVAAGLDPREFPSFLGEESLSWSFIKPAFYRPLGPIGGAYRVGPLARLNVAKSTGTPRADRELESFRALGQDGVVTASFYYHHARLIEMLCCVERIEALLGSPELYEPHVRARAMPNQPEGIGALEAPRGTLFHRYTIDEHGRVRTADLLIATAQNNTAMNLAVKQAARRYVEGARPREEMLNRVEAAIRCYDPCLSCSTHALGRMPLVIDVRKGGEIVERIARGEPC